jgi:SNF2 family DNA or RNA helicase
MTVTGIRKQAQDHAHRFGPKKEVQVFRVCIEFTIEKVLEGAYKKFRPWITPKITIVN